MERLLIGHRDGIVGLTQDERYLYSGSKDRTLRIWDKASGQCVHAIGGFPCSVRGAADNKRLYAITWHGLSHRRFSMWEKDSWFKIYETDLQARPGADLQGIALDGQHIFIPARDGSIFVIDSNTAVLQRVLQQSDNGIWDICTDKHNVYTASVDQTITIWEKGSWTIANRLHGHRTNIQRVIQDEEHIYSISTDKTLIIWSKSTGAIVRSISRVFKTGLLGLAVTERHLLVLSEAQGVIAWRKGHWLAPVLELPQVRSKNVVVDDSFAYFAMGDGTIAVFKHDSLGLK